MGAVDLERASEKLEDLCSSRATKRRRIDDGSVEQPLHVTRTDASKLNGIDLDSVTDAASAADSADALITPPAVDGDYSLKTDATTDHGARPGSSILERAAHVLATEAAALVAITDLYKTSRTAQIGLGDAVAAIVKAQRSANKLLICGVGKSGYIAQKLTATCKSLSIRSSFMHACEAVHGDLGDVREGDVLLFVSYSGKTPELLNLLPHLPDGITIVALSSHLDKEDCPLIRQVDRGILLPAPIPKREETTFGVSAPTTSTTVALAVADMLALTVADVLHGERKDEVFKRNHPGGAIGISEREVVKRKRKGEDVVQLELPSPSISASDDG